MNELLVAHNISKKFIIRNERGSSQSVQAVDGVSLNIGKEEIIGVVGESGCGKSTLGKLILKIHQPDEGSLSWKGQDITTLKGEPLKNIRKQMQIIFQDPFSSLNPRKTIRDIISQPLRIHKSGNASEIKDRCDTVMHEVGLDTSVAQRYPHQFSGGQRQRIGIARALVLEPEFIVCDESVSALDVSIQAQILNLLMELNERHGFATLFISHDLSVVEFISQRILVMYLGRIVESAPKSSLISNPLHPYTQALFAAFPVSDPTHRKNKHIVVGDVPSPIDPPSGCYFHTRCPMADQHCRTESPPLKEIAPGHRIACWKVNG